MLETYEKVNIMTTQDNAVLLVSIFEAAQTGARATTALIALLKKVSWTDAAFVEQARKAFVEGHIAGYLNVKREDSVKVIVKRKWRKDGTPNDTTRTLIEQRAVSAALAAFCYAATMAGMPKANGGTRAPKTRATSVPGARQPNTAAQVEGALANGTPESLQGDVIAIPKAMTTLDVGAFCLKIADVITKFENRNPGVKYEEFRVVMDDFVSAVRALNMRLVFAA